jgi:hypothetical protein
VKCCPKWLAPATLWKTRELPDVTAETAREETAETVTEEAAIVPSAATVTALPEMKADPRELPERQLPQKNRKEALTNAET